MKKFIFITIVIVITGMAILSTTIYFALHGNPISQYVMVKNTKQYLIAKGYKESELDSITASYSIKRNTNRIKGTIAYVVFKNEPNIKYQYIKWRNFGEIQQHCEHYNEKTRTYEVKGTEQLKNIEANCALKY
ncbi:DUF3139 domain-containing protein [Ectobacillus sp. sgz5001026]|uniref:DUF3139 domain-containing protein n=1 Tax=Ectobacillus sp. sgz5001026 TaxID=3242473 RepID=UPI0036D21DDE